MGLKVAHYYGWDGPRRSAWWSLLGLVRVAVLQVFRRKLYWLALGLGLLQFLLFFGIIYAVTQLPIPERRIEGRGRPVSREILFRQFGFNPLATEQSENGYVKFIDRQQGIVALLLAFSGSLLVGSDFRLGSLPFYLSRGITSLHYIVGKVLAVGAVVGLLTVLPATILFVEYGLFTTSTAYWWDNLDTLAGVWAYGLIWCLVLGVMLVAVSAYLQRMAPIAVVWTTLFILLPAMADRLQQSTGDPHWHLLNLRRSMESARLLIFQSPELVGPLGQRAAQAAVTLVAICTLCLALVVRKVRAVEVVQ